MNIQVDDYIKHKNFMDVAIRVRTIIELPDSIRVNGIWMNQGFVDSYSISYMERSIEIKLSELYAWRVCKNQNPKCLRYETWIPI